MKAAPSSCRVSTKRMSLRPCISVTMLLVVEPTTPKAYSTPSARNASRTAWPAFIVVSLPVIGSFAVRREAEVNVAHKRPGYQRAYETSGYRPTRMHPGRRLVARMRITVGDAPYREPRDARRVRTER